jgi:hypothetical protein
MRAAHLIGLLVIAGLVVGVGFVVRNISWREITVPAALRGEAATNDFYAVQRLTEQLGAHSERRRSMGELPSADAVVVLSDWNWSVIEKRRLQLERWVEAGGRLVITAALVSGAEDLERWSGLALHPTEAEREADDAEEEEQPERDSVMARLLQQLPGPCIEITAAIPQPGVRNLYSLCEHAEDSWLTSERTPAWALLDEEHMHVARTNVGRGSVTLVAAQPFGNRELFWGDHALLFTACAQLRKGDRVYFVSEGKGTPLLVLMWWHGAPVMLLSLLLVALWLWRGTLRFGPLAAVPDNAQRSLAAQLRGTARFVVRMGAGRALHAAVRRALHEAAGKRIPMYASLHEAARCDAIARATHIDATSLRQVLDPQVERNVAELHTAITLLEMARRKLTSGR